jgi:hypothetical protein
LGSAAAFGRTAWISIEPRVNLSASGTERILEGIIGDQHLSISKGGGIDLT